MNAGRKTAAVFLAILVFLLGSLSACSDDDAPAASSEAAAGKPSAQDGGMIDGAWRVDVTRSAQLPNVDAAELQALHAQFEKMLVRFNLRDGAMSVSMDGRTQTDSSRLFFVRTEEDGTQVYEQEGHGQVSLLMVDTKTLIFQDEDGTFVLKRAR